MADLVPLAGHGVLRYSLARVDSKGTVSAGMVARVLGWDRGDHLQFAVIAPATAPPAPSSRSASVVPSSPQPASRSAENSVPVAVVASVLVRRHRSGTYRLSRRGYLGLPAGVRRRCGIGVNSQVLLAADPSVDVVMIHPVAAVDAMMGAYHAGLLRGSAGD